MKRRSLAAMAALTALPAAVIVSTTVSTAATPASSITNARLTDSGNSGGSGVHVALSGTCVGGLVPATFTWTPQPGSTYQFKIVKSGGGTITINPAASDTSASVNLQPSTNYDITITINGTSTPPLGATTVSC
jgi:hypothetical protein